MNLTSPAEDDLSAGARPLGSSSNAYNAMLTTCIGLQKNDRKQERLEPTSSHQLFMSSPPKLFLKPF